MTSISSKKKKSSPRSSKKVAAKPSNGLPAPLGLTEVFAPCPTSVFSFNSTKQIKESNEIIAQDRAIKAIHLGLGIRRPGYNIYVAGYNGTGKTSVIRSFLEKWSTKSKVPDDWIYVYDFKQSNMAKAMKMPAGQGRPFRQAMELALKNLRTDIPVILQSEAYENAVNERISRNNDKQARRFSDLEKTAKKMNFQIKSTRMGIETIPIIEGRPLTEKEYSKLSDAERTKIERSRATLEPRVLDFARHVRSLEIEAKDYVQKLQKEFVAQIVDRFYDEVLHKFGKIEGIKEYIGEIKESILDNLIDFLDEGGRDDETSLTIPSVSDNKDALVKYHVNLFIDNTKADRAPVVIEDNPSYYNIFGKIEKNVEHGMFLTDFTMIKAGSIHRANGGYLVVEALDVFKMPSVWDMLKRILKSGKGFIEDMGENFSLFPTSGVRAEPIPLDVKIILIGTDEIYHLLYEYDHEFTKIFKVKADFDYRMPRIKTNINAYVSFIATRCHKENLLHFDRSGVAAVVEYGARLIDDQDQLSTQFGDIKDLTIEADYTAREEGSSLIKRDHVEKAIASKFHRLNLYESHLMDMLAKKEILVSVDGATIGQVNGLVIYDMGDYSFGKPSRITCTTAANEDGIVNVERAAKLSGHIHDKGVHILSGFLNNYLARKFAISLSASICFEQSYGMIDGDSATVAELCAVISAMSEIPILQKFAMTGSLNQFGEVQPIGGVNEKVEGFFKTVKVIGKQKSYSVIIPDTNQPNLMLSKETREAVESGFLKIYAVKYFWQVFELVTGRPLGSTSMNNREFEKGSALAIIEKKLSDLQAEYEKTHHKD